MKLVAFALLVIVSILFVQGATAQACTTNAECMAQKAYANEQIKLFNEQTAVAKLVATGDAKTAVALSWTATPSPTSIPTATEIPTSTFTPQPTNTPTETPVPSATKPDVIATMVQQVVGIAPTRTPSPNGHQSDKTAINILAAISVLVIVASFVVIVFRPQTFILRNRR